MELYEAVLGVILGIVVILALVGAFIKERRDWQTHRAIQKMAARY